MESDFPTWEQNKTHIQDYLYLLRKRIWLIFACFIVTFSLAFLYNSTQISVYQASATIEIQEKKDHVPLPNQSNYSYQNYSEKQRAFETHFKVIKSYPIIGNVVEKLNLRDTLKKQQKKKKPQGIRTILANFNQLINRYLDIIFVKKQEKKGTDISDQVPTLDPVVSAVRGSLTISPVIDTNLVNIICTHTDPVMTVRISNALAEVYKDHIERKQVDVNRDNFNWISQEIARLKKKLDLSEENLHKYKEKSKILSMEVDKNIESQELSQLQKDYNATLTGKSELQAQLGELENIIQETRHHVPIFIDNDILKDISNKLIKTQLELSQLYKTYKHKHPLVIKTKAHIATLENQFQQELVKKAYGIKSQIKVLTSKEKTLQATLKKYRERSIRSTPKNVRFSRLYKETQTNTELYNYLMKQLKSLDIRKKVKDQQISIVELAKLPTVPIRPRKRMNLIMGAITGLVLGISLAFFIEYMDRSIKGIDDVEKFLGLPVLGIVPRFERE